jgi:hypothetical protein
MSPANLHSIQVDIVDVESNLVVDTIVQIPLYVQRALVVLSGEEDLFLCLVMTDQDDAKTFLMHLTSCIQLYLTYRCAFSPEMVQKYEAFIEATCNMYFEVVRQAKTTSKIEETPHSQLEYQYRCFIPAQEFSSAGSSSSSFSESSKLSSKKSWILPENLPFFSRSPHHDKLLQNWREAFDDGLSGPLLIQICKLMSFCWDVKYAKLLEEACNLVLKSTSHQSKTGIQQSPQQAAQAPLQLITNFDAGENFLEHSLDVADLPHSGVRTSMFGLINRYFTCKPKLLQLFDELQILDNHHDIEIFSQSKKYLDILDTSVHWFRHCIADPAALEWENVPNIFSTRLGELWDAVESLIAMCMSENEFDENVALMSSWIAPEVSLLFVKLDANGEKSDELQPYEHTRKCTLSTLHISNFDAETFSNHTRKLHFTS